MTALAIAAIVSGLVAIAAAYVSIKLSNRLLDSLSEERKLSKAELSAAHKEAAVERGILLTRIQDPPLGMQLAIEQQQAAQPPSPLELVENAEDREPSLAEQRAQETMAAVSQTEAELRARGVDLDEDLSRS